MFGRVIHPEPGRKLKGIVSVPVRGKIFCIHKYRYVGDHIEDCGYEGEVIRHYRCDKCGRMVYVFGPTDILTMMPKF